jgi:DNA-binding beta-propeller fold protein YncE
VSVEEVLTAPTGSGLAEFSNAGVPISPSTLFTSSYLAAPIGLAIDPSGNVWASSELGNLVEFVGAAVPVVTPLSVGLKNDTLGTMP